MRRVLLCTDLKAWNLEGCKPKKATRLCAGLDRKNINIVFSGASSLQRALDLALQQQAKALTEPEACQPRDVRMCNRLVKDKMLNEAKSREDAILEVTAPGQYTEAQCKMCFTTELNITVAREEAPAEALFSRPFSREAGLHQGLQFLAVGGATAKSKFNVETLRAFVSGELEPVKNAGFDGVCFDIEKTQGGAEELAVAFTEAFAACKKAGLLVMITTSHTAPWDAPDKAKELIVDAWVRSPDVDIFSPQLYTMGYEDEPSFEQTPCGHGTDSLQKSRCSWDRLKSMRARWVPSLSRAAHYAQAADFFESLDIKTQGFVQWLDPEEKDVTEPKFLNPRDIDRYLMPGGTPV